MPYPVQLNQQETAQVDQFLTDMQTRCVGRYLVDLPASYQAGHDTFSAFINDNPIKTRMLYPPSFEQKIRLRKERLNATKTEDPQDMPYLKKVYKLPYGMKGVIFERNESEGVEDSARVLEAHLYVGMTAVEVEMKADDGSARRYDADRKQYPEMYGNNVPQKLAELIDLLSRMQARAETDIPTAPGLCIPNLFIKDGRKKQKENILVLYESKITPATSISFDSNNFIKEKDTLLERINGITVYALLNQINNTNFRKGKRNIIGMNSAEEWLSEADHSERKKYREREFVMNVNETTGSSISPYLTVNMTPDINFSESVAIGIWDKITDTLRYRPNAF